jgi:catechol 2,3-dioxygenase-like lactoylglutathione lyase family enzyme
MSTISHPRAINHVGVGVADLDAAVEWYTTIMGFSVVKQGFFVTSDGGYDGDMAVNVLGKTFRKMRMAHLAAANGVGFEIFQLIDPPHERKTQSLEYWKNGFFHICVTDPNVEELVESITLHGGKQLSRIWLIEPEQPGFRMCYCEDPFGNILEIYSHNYEMLYGGI